MKAPKPVVVTPAATETVAAPAVSPDAAGQEARQENQRRAQRGLAGTIATSGRGVLGEAPSTLAAARKTLLGD